MAQVLMCLTGAFFGGLCVRVMKVTRQMSVIHASPPPCPYDYPCPGHSNSEQITCTTMAFIAVGGQQVIHRSKIY